MTVTVPRTRPRAARRAATGPPGRRPRRGHGISYAFLLPAGALYAVFILYPLAESVFLSLTSWDGAQPEKEFVGLANFERMLGDELFWRSLGHNVVWVVLGTAATMAVAMLLAMLVWSRPRGFTAFRTLYFMPQVLPAVIVGIVWSWIYNPAFGILNRALEAVGLESWARGWLGDPDLALYAVLAAAVWAQIGLAFVIFTAALQNVDTDLIDAARVDGANAWQRFRNVVVPQLANAITLVTVLLLTHGFQAFDHVWIMTKGGPDDSTQLIATYTYQKAFMENEVGYGATLSLVLTVISLIVSVAVVRVRERERISL
ncbi:ABC-type sugar transport system permease subunit [Thermocatellispora tengchongensis]|uniref:ABC-type sugar transport system permease subunit n=1 Tax=Thermocatellispora tengchongensis TaxID=1073253 RepID=A0A840PCY0_9ACTN|nr:sugar ABC transporter permease [Thermocatellispora tengchongensis]MBB5135280.1 ABC-type sugar transport system permease subunit [Thermocatellispora tengchongensis]